MSKQEHENEILVLEGMLSAYRGNVATFERKLARVKHKRAEAEKPELRHGDYGRTPLGASWIFLNGRIFTEITNYVPQAPDQEYIQDRIGNIFDYLKALSEPLKDKTFYIGGVKFTAFGGKLHAGAHGDGYRIEIEISRLPEFILNLQRLIFTEKEAPHE